METPLYYRNVLRTWRHLVNALSRLDPSLASNLDGDPPVWIKDVMRALDLPQTERDEAFAEVDAYLKVEQDQYFGCGSKGDFADRMFQEYHQIRDAMRRIQREGFHDPRTTAKDAS